MDRVFWTDKRLARITLLDLMLIDDAYQVVQCTGLLQDGTETLVALPFSKLPRYGLRHRIVKYAKEDNVYAKGLGIFDAIT